MAAKVRERLFAVRFFRLLMARIVVKIADLWSKCFIVLNIFIGFEIFVKINLLPEKRTKHFLERFVKVFM
jgi:hypothetical protein